MRKNFFLVVLLFTLISILVPLTGLMAMNARVEAVDGETLTVKDLSLEGRRHFSVDWKGGATTIEWKDISAFEIRQVGQNFWVEVLFTSGGKEPFRIRQYSHFKGKTDFGQWSVPFEKIKKVVFARDEETGKKEETLAVKESNVQPRKELDRIILRNGDILLGAVAEEIVSIRTLYGTVSFKKEDLVRVAFGLSGKSQKEKEPDALYSRYGDKLTGAIASAQMRMVLLTGTSLPILREHIKEIEFGVTIETSERPGLEKSMESPALRSQP